ncbi:MAG: peptidoglycan editing factor PgeF [Clostridia bacterium]|nr:peptidoglycan editing factor PgeF [Clostridia bacterium]
MNKQITNNDSIIYVKNDGVEYIQFKNFKKYEGIISHCFTTRLGGVSTGECSFLNLGFNRKDLRENVEENYSRIAGALNINCSNMVFSNQVHDNKIKSVTEDDRGKGILRESDIIGYDGLITNKKEVALVTFYADCVPVFFFEPERKVIAISHSGWRGTVKEIARETVMKMVNEYGCSASKIEAAIGPSISQCCFEVGDEVYNEFIEKLNWSEKYCSKKSDGKWLINLQGIIRDTLIDAGVPEDNICVSGICTKCNNDVFFSHRGDKGKTGSLAAIMQIN